MAKQYLREELELWKQGHEVVVGIDEAGRGPLAGPVVAAAFTILDTKYKIQDTQVRDSKALSAKQRENIYGELLGDPVVRWGIGIVSEKIIDEKNIFQATKLAMRRALNNLKRKLKKEGSTPSFLIIDGTFPINVRVQQQPIIKADETVFSCTAASIIAKVKRDRIMLRYHGIYPNYGFDKHKGYGTKFHVAMLRKYGPCDIHRKSFRPVSSV